MSCKELELRVTFPSLIRSFITLSSCQRLGGQEVCVQEVAFPSPSYRDTWKGNRGLISGPGQESRSRLLQEALVCLFQKGSEHCGPVKCSRKMPRLNATLRTLLNSNLSRCVLLCVIKLLPKAWRVFVFFF